MKNRPLFAIALACSAKALPALAASDYTHLYGTPVPESTAGRTIVITPDTRYLNVEGGEIVRFVADGNTFVWHFNVVRTVHAFDLNEVAPQGVLRQTVRAYVAADPRYLAP